MLFFPPLLLLLVWLACTSVWFWVHSWIAASIASGESVCCSFQVNWHILHKHFYLSAGDDSKFEIQNLICILLSPEVVSCLLQPFGSLWLGHQSKNLIVYLAAAVWSWWDWEEPWAHSCASRAPYLQTVCSRIWGASEALVKWAEVVLTVTQNCSWGSPGIHCQRCEPNTGVSLLLSEPGLCICV